MEHWGVDVEWCPWAQNSVNIIVYLLGVGIAIVPSVGIGTFICPMSCLLTFEASVPVSQSCWRLGSCSIPGWGSVAIPESIP